MRIFVRPHKQRIPRKAKAAEALSRIRGLQIGSPLRLLYGFPKSERDNIGDDELAHWRKVATSYLQVSPEKLEELIELAR